MCQQCPKKATCVAACERLLAAAVIVRLQRKARATLEKLAQSDAPKKSGKTIGAVVLALALATADAATPFGHAGFTEADSRIGDGPDDIITIETYECVGQSGLLFYVRFLPSDSIATCQRIDLRRPVLVLPEEF